MTEPQHPDDQAASPAPGPLAGDDAARHVLHVTGMSPEAAKAYAAFHSGLWAQGPAGTRAA
jgi:hypothetical protein